MPPKKTKPTKEQLKGLVDEYNIKFEGPVPPKLWPSQYNHLFHVIRDIWANRYDDYVKRTDISQKTIRGQRARVRDLRTNASRLRTDFGINEETWRASIETLVFRRFDQEIVWSVLLIFWKVVTSLFPVSVYCRNENWQSEYKAQPFDEDEKEKLETKRSRRSLCTCDDGNNAGRNLNEDR
jgi:DNA-binding winged helix-turn-helix (wHTH) protein